MGNVKTSCRIQAQDHPFKFCYAWMKMLLWDSRGVCYHLKGWTIDLHKCCSTSRYTARLLMHKHTPFPLLQHHLPFSLSIELIHKCKLLVQLLVNYDTIAPILGVHVSEFFCLFNLPFIELTCKVLSSLVHNLLT